jgi:hypothetical protein
MSFIRREWEILDARLRATEESDPLWKPLRAARQALAWALDPECFKRPSLSVMGSRQGSEDCPSKSCPPQSLDISDHRELRQ